MERIKINNKKLLKGLAITGTVASYLAAWYIVYMSTVLVAYKAASIAGEAIDKFIDNKVKKESETVDLRKACKEVKIPPTPSFIPFDQDTSNVDHGEADNPADKQAVSWNASLEE